MKYIAISFFSALLLGGCVKEYDHLFDLGQCVQMKMDGHKGMVIRSRKNSDELAVRFTANTAVITTSILGGSRDVKNKPYTTIYVREFELIKCED